VTVIVERDNHILIGGRATLIEEGRELAWAERYVRQDPDIKWILGNFVEADNANDNGHIFPLDDLKTAQRTIAMKPLNMLHHAQYVVGAFAGAELMYPTGAAEGAAAGNPYVEALAAFWRGNFEEEYLAVEAAHKEGALFYSMECVPQSLTCPEEDCGHEAVYAGRQHETYCDHMNAPRGGKRLNKPHFNAGAIIIPPVKPGWRGANIGQIAGLVSQHADREEEYERVYAQVSEEFPHLGAREWEQMMEMLVGAADLKR
jgi:hypothetical protein